jgi:hypothetical protein
MTTTLPQEVQRVFERFITTEYTTIDATGQPITWPVTPYYRAGDGAIDITTAVGYPKKADDAERNPRVALLFSDPTGSGIEDPCAVLVQGPAEVDDRNLDANRERYMRESLEKLPATKDMLPPAFMRRMFDWYFTRIYVYVRPERVFIWDKGDFSAEPELFDSRIEEVRTHHSAEPAVEPPVPEGGPVRWDDRLDELDRRHRTAVLSVVAPDGFPMSCRLPIRLDRASGSIVLGELPEWMPTPSGKACLCAHEHEPEFRWQTNFHVRGDLLHTNVGWSLVPHRLVGGFELPPSAIKRWTVNAPKMMRFRKVAKDELARRRARA